MVIVPRIVEPVSNAAEFGRWPGARRDDHNASSTKIRYRNGAGPHRALVRQVGVAAVSDYVTGQPPKRSWRILRAFRPYIRWEAMAWLLKSIETGKASRVVLPEIEETVYTNFIR
jgi:hypothetical protein